MFTITESAARFIKAQMESEGEGEMYLRVFVRPGADGMQFGMSSEEKPGKNDEVSDQYGLKVLVDKLSMRTLDGVVLSLTEDGGFNLGKPADAETDSDGE
ncbi:MAG: iron-sulfur cluster assembly accessory protein [Chloroflexota bacterium]|nr:iron-sulfur cluster assembly accessory protein [Chloroflexota bacterium]MDE2840544.1 iron-sulfur cluster assembly accessory protein [Chloroflexota bacterium]MDE2931723.1 iron-sulfur cluster assembly accessory protein [Chloroflexota bacterium]